MCLSISNSPFPMCLCLCKADKYWHLFCRNSLCTRSVQLQFILQVADTSLKTGLDSGVSFLFFRIWLTHAQCLLSELQGNCQSELVPIVIYCVGLRWQFFCLTRKLGFDIYRAVPISVIHKPKFALLLPGKPTQEK